MSALPLRLLDAKGGCLRVVSLGPDRVCIRVEHSDGTISESVMDAAGARLVRNALVEWLEEQAEG